MIARSTPRQQPRKTLTKGEVLGLIKTPQVFIFQNFFSEEILAPSSLSIELDQEIEWIAMPT